VRVTRGKYPPSLPLARPPSVPCGRARPASTDSKT
jgi:hypothetical protein